MYRENNTHRQGRFFIGGLILLIGFSAGFWFRGTTDSSASPAKVLLQSDQAAQVDSNVDFDLFWTVWKEVKATYVNQPVSDETLFYGALQGIASSVKDPYTEFFTPEDSAKFEANLKGEFEGIGAEIGLKENQLVVISPLANSPAEQAGLLAGDAITKIGDKDTTGISLEEAVGLIRGDKGTTVVLTIYRAGDADLREISVTRDTIEVPNVEYELQKVNDVSVAVITISQFNEGVAKEFNDAAKQALLDNAGAVIIDVRNNPGGLLTDSIEIASHMVKDGVIVSEVFSDGKSEVHNSLGYGTLVGLPTAVLVNKGSASASEILAGALQDHKVATIIGEQSYGKGSVQDYRSFTDGSSLKITIAKWFTPNQTSIQEHGITPDVVVERTSDDVVNERDPQLDKAISVVTDAAKAGLAGNAEIQ